jgi:hypothetical protein
VVVDVAVSVSVDVVVVAVAVSDSVVGAVDSAVPFPVSVEATSVWRLDFHAGRSPDQILDSHPWMNVPSELSESEVHPQSQCRLVSAHRSVEQVERRHSESTEELSGELAA